MVPGSVFEVGWVMHFQVEDLVSDQELEQLQTRLVSLDDSAWLPGSQTAGSYAKQVKNNWQLDKQHPDFEALADLVLTALDGHPLFRAASIPLKIHSLLFSRCGVGEGYGRHVDNPFMPGGRTDLSFTLFLSHLDAYSGGGLTLELPQGEDTLRLPAGSAIVYPSGYLHRVEPVTAGVRYVAVGWVQSAVRSSEQRELLFELETACKALAASHGRSDALDLLYRCHTNLMRMWAG
jgi:PKHD-type hydroxylase